MTTYEDRLELLRQFALFGGIERDSMAGFMLALNHAQQQAVQREVRSKYVGEDWQEKMLLAVGVLNFITGKMGTGKTNTAAWRTHHAHHEGYVCGGNVKMFNVPYYTFIEKVSDFNKWLLSHKKQKKHFLFDDIGVGYGGHRSWQDKSNLMLVDFVRICRKEPNRVAVDMIAHKKRYADLMLAEMANEVWHLPDLLPRPCPDNHMATLAARDVIEGTLLWWTDKVNKAPIAFDTDHIARWIVDEELIGLQEETKDMADAVNKTLAELGIKVTAPSSLKKNVVAAVMERLHMPKIYLDRIHGELLLRLYAGEYIGKVG